MLHSYIIYMHVLEVKKSPLVCVKMKLVSVVLLGSLLTCAFAGLLDSMKNGPRSAGQSSIPIFCKSLPLPSLEADVLLSKLQPYLDQVDGKVQEALKEDNSTGGAVLSVVYKNTTIWSKGYGLVDMSNPSRGPPDVNSGFRIGSITKIFTALMTLMLRDTKLLRSLDADVSEYLQEFTITNPFKTGRGITFRQLMSHMSGLPRECPCANIFVTGCDLSDAEIYKNLADIELMYPPGQQPAYSNLGFGLLGRALEKITHAKWEEMVKLLVFDQLGMTTSGNTFTDDDIKKLALGYYANGSLAEFISIGWESPAGQTYSSASDLGKLMALMFSTDKPRNTKMGQILDGETIREWTAPAYKYPDHTGFSFPWELIPLGNYTLRTKDGAINGYRAEFQMASEIKTGFIFLQSCDGCASHRKIIEIAQGILLETDAVLGMNQPPPSVPTNPAEYIGVYVAEIGGVQDIVNITFAMPFGHPALFTMEGGDMGLLEWREKDSFQITVRGFPVPCFVLHSGHIGAWIHFQRDKNGKLATLTAPGISYGVVWERQA